MGISGTWVNALTVRVMNTGCDRHLIASVSVKISTMDLSVCKRPLGNLGYTQKGCLLPERVDK